MISDWVVRKFDLRSSVRIWKAGHSAAKNREEIEVNSFDPAVLMLHDFAHKDIECWVASGSDPVAAIHTM